MVTIAAGGQRGGLCMGCEVGEDGISVTRYW
jgi:hypothetical protein